LKEEALDRTLWGTRLGRGYGRVTHNTELQNTVTIFAAYCSTYTALNTGSNILRIRISAVLPLSRQILRVITGKYLQSFVQFIECYWGLIDKDRLGPNPTKNYMQ
jgi:hypothetical protein